MVTYSVPDAEHRRPLRYGAGAFGAALMQVPLFGPSTPYLRVWKTDGTDGIGWDDLQAIKNEVLGEEWAAIEVYPRADDVINHGHMRHLWGVPADVIAGVFVPADPPVAR